MCSNVSNKGEQIVRSSCCSTNTSGGRQKKAELDGLMPCGLQSEESSKEYRKNSARLTQRICVSAIDFNNNSLVRSTIIPLSLTIIIRCA